MKKKSRFLTGLLSAVMALSLCAMPVMAEDVAVGEAATVADVWTQDTGSITIHKYEYNGNEKPAATGKESDVSKVPAEAKPLEGAEFSIYQVMGRDELANYYDGKSDKDTVTVKTYLDEEGKNIKAEQSYSTAVRTVTTNSEGIAKFDDLALGLYVVIETKTPDKVTSPVKPFLVSVPMTVSTTTGDVTKSEWLYDIHVYPKNGTTYGEVKIVKKGCKGSETPSVLKDVTFTLEKLGEDGQWQPVTASDKDGTAFNLTTDAQGEISVSGLSQGKYRFIEQSIAGNNSYIIDTTPIEFEVTATGTIKYGDKEAAAIEIPVINEQPDVEKNVVDKTGNVTTDTDYSVGDHVPYQVTVTVPRNITKLTTFTVTDTPENLKYDAGSIKLVCGEDTVKAKAYTLDETKPENGFTIKFDPDQMADYAGRDIVITYTATLTEKADHTTKGNPNTVKLEYSNKIGVDEDGNKTEESKKDISDDTVVYTFGLKVFKKADDTNAALADVEFDLYKEDVNGTITGDAAKALGLDSTKKWTKINDVPLVSGSDGYIKQNGLANGTYYLVETKTVDGYNLLKAPVEVKLNIIEQTNWNETYTYDSQGNVIKHAVSKKTTTFTGGDADDPSEYTVTVINRKGFDLPVTGGFGTLLFSAIGVLLVVGGVGVLMSTKKKKGNA